MEKNYYEIRAVPNGIDKYEDFKKNGYIAIQWSEIGDVSRLKKDQIRAKLEIFDPYDRNPQKKEVGYKATISQRTSFFERLKNIKIGDVILVPTDKGKNVSIFEVDKPYYFDEENISSDTAHRIGVKGKVSVSRSEISKSLNKALNAMLTITKISPDKYDEIEYLIANVQYLKDAFAFESTIRLLHNTYKASNDDIIKKSLLFSAFSLCEAYFKEFIRSADNSALGEADKKKFYIYLRNHNGRIELFQKIFSQEEGPSFPRNEHQQLRNALAHDISSPIIEEDLILIYEDDKLKYYFNVEELFKCIEEFPDTIEKDSKK
ncbi:hypothetical protein ACI1TN_10105 [Lactococcus garvieae]|uniref:hypothetical protein n=1 Tax=Lactococcus garvieae TaxID=1363 RepID=UPI00385344F6